MSHMTISDAAAAAAVTKTTFIPQPIGTTAMTTSFSEPLRTLVSIATLAVAATLATGCSTPANLDLSLDKRSAAGTYQVGLVAPAINQIHSWKVTLATPEGQAVAGATFAVDGGMPQHGHGLPTKQRVTRDLGNGTYQLDGMKFSMTGWWEVKLDIKGPAGPDKVTFNTVVNNPPVRQ